MGGYAIGQAVRLGGNLILARIFFPAAFGEMALVFAFITGLAMFSDVGTGPAIVQSDRGDDPSFLRTAWTIQCGRGVALSIASWAIAWPAAAFYDHPSLRWLIPAAALNALIAGFESTAVHAEQRHLRLGRLTILDLVGQTTGMVATIILAILDRKYRGANDHLATWAMIAGSWVSSLTRLAMSHTYLPGIKHRFQIDRDAAAHLIRFGRWVFVSTVLTFFAAQSDRLIFGKMIPVSILGLYSIAATLAALPTEAVSKLGNNVLFPAYSRLAGREDFRRVFTRVRLPLVLAGAAVVSGLVASGPFLIRLLYDRRYADAGWIIQYLSAGAWFRMLEVTVSAAVLAKGQVRWLAAGNAAKVVGLIALVPLGFHLDGLRGALLGVIGADVLKYLTSAVAAATAGLRGLGPDTLLGLGVAAISTAGFLAGRFSGGATGSNLVALLVSAVVAGVPWGAAALWRFGQERGWFAARAQAVGVPPP
jgi:O-antigen/teichoic acid export membrane protein